MSIGPILSVLSAQSYSFGPSSVARLYPFTFPPSIFILPPSKFLNPSPLSTFLQLFSFPASRLPARRADSSPIWTLHCHDHTSVIKIFDNFSGLKRMLVLPPDLKRADLYFEEKYDHFMGPFAGPAMELLMINYLARVGGVILHACSIEHQGKGYLFAGQSGAGKSTLSTLWDQQKGGEVLSDDRTIVRKQDGQFRMYGTPWHGDATFGSPRGVKLERIFFPGTRSQKCLPGFPRIRCHAGVSQMLVSTLLGCPGDGIGDGNI